jgi:hypothetical protein
MKATRSGNARIHNMTSVTPALLAYITTQVSRATPFHVSFLIDISRFVSRLRLPVHLLETIL